VHGYVLVRGDELAVQSRFARALRARPQVSSGRRTRDLKPLEVDPPRDPRPSFVPHPMKCQDPDQFLGGRSNRSSPYSFLRR